MCVLPVGISHFIPSERVVNSKGLLSCLSLILVVSAMVAIQRMRWSSEMTENRRDSQSLRVGTNVWLGYEPLYLARSLGHYEESDVRLVEYSSASQVIRAFRNNTIEVAALTLDEVLLLKENGFDVRVILVTDISQGADAILSASEITELSELRGRNIGVEHTALGAYVLTRALQSVGMTATDVNVVPLEVDEHERAFTEGTVDAVVTFEPVRSRLLAQGARVLFDSTQIPDEIVDVLAVRLNVFDTESDKLRILLKGWFLGRRYVVDHPDDASKQMAERLRLDPPDVLASLPDVKMPDLKENIDLLGGVRPKLVESAERLGKLMLEQDLLLRNVDVSQLFSAEPLKGIRDK